MVVYEDFCVESKPRGDSRPASVAPFHAPLSYPQSPSLEDAHGHALRNHQDAMERLAVSPSIIVTMPFVYIALFPGFDPRS